MNSISVGCPTCDRVGYAANGNPCINCGGTGHIVMEQVPYNVICQEEDSLKEGTMAIIEDEPKVVCQACGGTGIIDDDIDDEGTACPVTCNACGGSGYEN